MSAQDKERLNEELEKENIETPEAETEETAEEAKTENCQEEIEKLKAELDDWKNSYMRKQADFQNFTKRKRERNGGT